MANTFRTLSDLLGRYPDNSQGAISAQDLRDGVVSWHAMPNVVPVDSYGDSTDRTSRATAVQAAINDASSKGLGYVMVTEDFLNYDASAVTFDNSVRMVREGQVGDVYDVKAYGAAGDDPGDGTGTDDLNALEAAASALPDAGGVLVLSGSHRISARWDLPDKSFVLNAEQGRLIPDGDFTVVRTPAGSSFITLVGQRGFTAINVPGGVTHTSDGIVIRCRVMARGPFTVGGAGRHGVFFNQDSDNANSNLSYGAFSAQDCGGDGVRIEQTGGTAVNLNGMQLDLVRLKDNDVGCRVLHGVGHQIRVTGDGNTNEILKYPAASAATEQSVWVYDDASNGAGVDLSGGSGLITGLFNAGLPNTSDQWVLVEGGDFTGERDGPLVWRFFNQSSAAGSDLRVRLATARAGLQLEMRVAGDETTLLDATDVLRIRAGKRLEVNAGGNLDLRHTGDLLMGDLPTSDPTVAGAVWNDAGTLKVSSG